MESIQAKSQNLWEEGGKVFEIWQQCSKFSATLHFIRPFPCTEAVHVSLLSVGMEQNKYDSQEVDHHSWYLRIIR
jgi:hypothetical protein